MQTSTSSFKIGSATDRMDLVTLILRDLGRYWSLLTEVTQTHVLPFHQFQQFHLPGCILSSNSRCRIMRRTVSQAIEVLEVRLKALYELRARIEVASFDADLEQNLVSALPAEFEVLG